MVSLSYHLGCTLKLKSAPEKTACIFKNSFLFLCLVCSVVVFFPLNLLHFFKIVYRSQTGAVIADF